MFSAWITRACVRRRRPLLGSLMLRQCGVPMDQNASTKKTALVGVNPCGCITARLGHTQRLIMDLLALGEGPKSIRHLAYDWPGPSEDAVRSAVGRLERRGFVAAAGWEPAGGRTYTLTPSGESVLENDREPAS